MTTDDAWMSKGLCRTVMNPDPIFFPVVRKGEHHNYREAKMICHDCPVRKVCFAYAITHRITEGVWGGTTPNERKQVPISHRIQIRKVWWVHFPGSKTYAVRR